MKRIRHRSESFSVGSVLRTLIGRFDADELVYDPRRRALPNDVVLCEIDEIPELGENPHEHSVESVECDGDQLTFRLDAPSPGLRAAAVGNRYAPCTVIGGLQNPMSGQDNGPVFGGTVLHDLGTYNVLGFINQAIYPRRRGRVKVLGVVLDDDGRAVNLADHRPRWSVQSPHPCLGVLVCGSLMDVGKSSCCVALARELRSRGLRVTFEKKTGTGSFRDALRVQTEDLQLLEEEGSHHVVDYPHILVSDFVESGGAVSDVSGRPETFVENSLAFTPGFLADRRPDVHIVELADNFSHRTNLALLGSSSFRSLFQALVYLPGFSFDAAHHFLHFLRESVGWKDVAVAFSGPIANDPPWAVLREEIELRLQIPCLRALRLEPQPVVDASPLADWVLKYAPPGTCGRSP